MRVSLSNAEHGTATHEEALGTMQKALRCVSLPPATPFHTPSRHALRPFLAVPRASSFVTAPCSAMLEDYTGKELITCVN